MLMYSIQYLKQSNPQILRFIDLLVIFMEYILLPGTVQRFHNLIMLNVTKVNKEIIQ